MSNRQPYIVTYPETETRQSVLLRVGGMTPQFNRYDETREQLLMIEDDVADGLRRDRWGVEGPLTKNQAEKWIADRAPAEPVAEPEPADTAPESEEE